MEGSWHLNVIRSMQHGRVNVSSCPCVYCCLHIDLFPDTWAMTWKEFRLQQILHHTSMWPLGLNKGKSITLLLWWPWQSHDEECWCHQPCTGWWHRQHILAWLQHERCSACASSLPEPARLPLGQGCALWMENQKTPTLLPGPVKISPYLFWGESGSCGKGERGVPRLVQLIQILVSGSWRISGKPVRTAFAC